MGEFGDFGGCSKGLFTCVFAAETAWWVYRVVVAEGNNLSTQATGEHWRAFPATLQLAVFQRIVSFVT